MITLALWLFPVFAHAAPAVTPALSVDPKSLPPGWTVEDSSRLPVPDQSEQTLMFETRVNDVPIATVNVRYSNKRDGAMPDDPREWLRLMFGYRDPKTKLDWRGVKDARFVTSPAGRTLRAVLTVPPAMLSKYPKDHRVAVWAREFEDQVLILTYDRQVVSFDRGIGAVRRLFARVRAARP